MTTKDLNLGKKISIIYRHNHIFLEKHLKAYGIGSGQYPFIFYILGHDGVTQDDLCKVFEVDKATTARAIKKLEANGLIYKEINSDDRRSHYIHPTQKTLDMKTDIQKIKIKWQNKIVQDLTIEEINTFNTLLDKLVHNSINCIHHKED